MYGGRIGNMPLGLVGQHFATLYDKSFSKSSVPVSRSSMLMQSSMSKVSSSCQKVSGSCQRLAVHGEG